jgi:hypothetical protein
MNKLIKFATTISRKDQKVIKGGQSVEVGCVRPGDIHCLDVYQPVVCADGGTYSNGCYAYLACQTDCQPWGGDLA